MSSTDLDSSTDLATVGFLDTTESSLVFEPDPNFFNTATLLSLLGSFSAELEGEVGDLVGSIDSLEGTVAVENGVFTTDITFPEGALQETIDVPAGLRGLADLGAITSGVLNINDGIVNGSITTGETVLGLESLDFAATASALVEQFLTGLEGTFTFADGIFAVDAGTPFGAVTGTVGFAGGALTLDLLTPAGAIAGTVDFPDDAVIPFDFPVLMGTLPGAVDFNRGYVFAGPVRFFPPVPLEELSGSIFVDDGLATLDLQTPLGILPVEFEFGSLASSTVFDTLTNFSGSATVTDGVIDASLTTPFG
ncbi:MAG TPA: hypothetical protein V6D06_06850, partial [Trichocoleus sp.]